jgi:hypothetical protein
MRERAAKERGVPVQRSAVPIARHMQKLYPEAEVIEQRRLR